MTTWTHPPPRQTRGIIVLIGPLDQTPMFSNPLMLPFNTQVCHQCQMCLRFNWILKVNRFWPFQLIAHRFESWIEFLWPLLTKLHEFKCIYNWCYHWVQRCVMAPYQGGWKLCSGAWKRGRVSHVGMFSQAMTELDLGPQLEDTWPCMQVQVTMVTRSMQPCLGNANSHRLTRA